MRIWVLGWKDDKGREHAKVFDDFDAAAAWRENYLAPSEYATSQIWDL